MVSKEQAMTANRFEHVTLKNKDGTPVRVRRSGKTGIWKTRPNEFYFPVKYGYKKSLYINQCNAHEWNVAE